MYSFAPGQLSILLLITFLQIAFLTVFKPFDEPLVGKLELMNEIFNVFGIDVMFMLTDVCTDAG